MSNMQEALKKIHVLQVVGEPVGGIRKHVHSIIEGLGSSYMHSYAYSKTDVDVKFEIDIERIGSRISGIIPLCIRKKPGFRDMQNLYCLIKYVRKEKVDIIHGHGAKGGLYARLVAYVCGIKSIYTPHGGVVHSMFSPTEEKIYSLVEKILYGITDYFIFESNYTADAFHSKVGRSTGRWVVNYNGVNIPDIDLLARQANDLNIDCLHDGVIHVGVFGMLRKQKGQEWAIRAVEQLKDKVHLHVFGDGPDKKMLEELAKKVGVSKSVTFYGDVSNVMPYMHVMDVILVPSLFESFGYVAVEAMSCSKPLITTLVGGLQEVVNKKESICIRPGCAEEIACALKLYLEDADKYKSNAISTRNRVAELFSVDRMLNNIESVYGLFDIDIN